MKLSLSSAIVLLVCAASTVFCGFPPAPVDGPAQPAESIERSLQALETARGKQERYRLFISLAQAYAETGNFDKALDAGQRAILLMPRREEARLLVAQVYGASELYELARQEYLTILKEHRRSYRAHYELGRLYQRQGLTTQAMTYYTEAMKIEPATELLRAMAECQQSAGAQDSAEEYLERALAQEQRYDDLLRLGKLKEQRKDYAAAERLLASAIALDPGRLDAYLQQGFIYLAMNDLTRAERSLRAAQEKAPQEGSIHFFRAVIAFRQGDIAGALRENAEAMWLSKSEILTAYTYKFSYFLASRKKK